MEGLLSTGPTPSSFLLFSLFMMLSLHCVGGECCGYLSGVASAGVHDGQLEAPEGLDHHHVGDAVVQPDHEGEEDEEEWDGVGVRDS